MSWPANSFLLKAYRWLLEYCSSFMLILISTLTAVKLNHPPFPNQTIGTLTQHKCQTVIQIQVEFHHFHEL